MSGPLALDAVARDTGAGKFQVAVQVAGTALLLDEPVSVGGMGSGPTPYQLLASALAACTTMTLRVYALQKGWPVTGIRTLAGHQRQAGIVPADLFTRRIEIDGDLDAAQRARLLEIADRCPVHRTLTGGARVETELAAAAAPSEPASAHAEDLEHAIREG
ncbi:OsmC family protein [Sphingomonas pokkalii]|uniref:Osmotically inducible protein OsmC n=1 Tax=Sphingomonas pokkalii TaxID=2175090 RepID=A0A2U0SG67_9SPHN|nr:OsmC family protein [Sphingomonas pokkalii]PVX30373.1 osmotically inducible protein OsmC [Sphingomonas pokkalii]